MGGKNGNGRVHVKKAYEFFCGIPGAPRCVSVLGGKNARLPKSQKRLVGGIVKGGGKNVGEMTSKKQGQIADQKKIES